MSNRGRPSLGANAKLWSIATKGTKQEHDEVRAQAEAEHLDTSAFVRGAIVLRQSKRDVMLVWSVVNAMLSRAKSELEGDLELATELLDAARGLLNEVEPQRILQTKGRSARAAAAKAKELAAGLPKRDLETAIQNTLTEVYHDN